MDWERLRTELRERALSAGWAALGVTDTGVLEEARRHGVEAVRAGRMDGMPWMTEERVVAATGLGERYPWARCLVALAWPYAPAVAGTGAPGRPRGRVAAYALLENRSGDVADYHDVMARGCDDLVAWLRERVPGVRAKRFIDHGWAMDRAIAERAGLGFAGKNACLITGAAGSYVLLAELALSIPLPVDAPSRKGCGSCTRCLPACPTGAIVAPGVIDARRCISYLTIEHRGPIDEDLRPLMGTWVFGCDLCQEACPINHRLAPAPAPAAVRGRPVEASADLVDLLECDEGEFARRFGGTAVERAGRAGLARNAAIALGNAGDPATLPALSRAARVDPDPVVREAASWAEGRVRAGRKEPDEPR